MAKAHHMTPKRRAALRKAQAASARKRRGTGKRRRGVGGHVKRALIAGAISGGMAGAAIYASHRMEMQHRQLTAQMAQDKINRNRAMASINVKMHHAEGRHKQMKHLVHGLEHRARRRKAGNN